MSSNSKPTEGTYFKYEEKPGQGVLDFEEQWREQYRENQSPATEAQWIIGDGEDLMKASKVKEFPRSSENWKPKRWSLVWIRPGILGGWVDAWLLERIYIYISLVL